MKPLLKIKCRGLVKGHAIGPALVSQEVISFLGDLDIRSGKIVGELPSVKGKSVCGKILVIPGSSGSAGAWRFLFQMHKHNTHPLAIVSKELPDPSVVQGAILTGIPILCDPDTYVIENIKNDDMIELDGDGTIQILSRS